MGRRFVIGTAGHIDHGKTALVKALTGVDTDRWEEEKRRGITIDLGFAPLPLGNGVTASVVDVPGHEGFVRNMLAGATGIDLALLVIAADAGFMPQTEEHLAIVELLGVRAGVPVITKADLVDREWLAMMTDEVRQRLGRSSIAWTDPVATSAASGEGLDALRVALRAAGERVLERAAEDLFRLPIDRVFTVAGAGTVVTGTTWSGSVRVGEQVTLLPLDRQARVRSIEVHGQATDRAEPGRRTALALVGVEKEELERGHVAVTGQGWRPTRMMDVRLELLPSAARPLRPRTRVRVHLGTAAVLARVGGIAEIPPGASGVARLVLEEALVARAGDRFVLRSFSPVTTIGGGAVLDPLPPGGPLRRRRLADGGTPADWLRLLVEEAGLAGLARWSLPARLGIRPAEVDGVVAGVGAPLFAFGETLVARAALSTEVTRLAQLVEAHHRDHPLDPGMSLQALRSAVSAPPAIVDQILDLAVRKQTLEVAAALVRRPGWKPALDARAGDAAAKVAERLRQARWQVPTLGELERELPGVPVQALLLLAVREGHVEQVDSERYMDRAALRDWESSLVQAIRELGPATPARLRDRFGLSRKYLIPLLEWADRRGVTRRDGDARVLTRPIAAGQPPEPRPL